MWNFLTGFVFDICVLKHCVFSDNVSVEVTLQLIGVDVKSPTN